jgi:hypothetical protein
MQIGLFSFPKNVINYDKKLISSFDIRQKHLYIIVRLEKQLELLFFRKSMKNILTCLTNRVPFVVGPNYKYRFMRLKI